MPRLRATGFFVLSVGFVLAAASGARPALAQDCNERLSAAEDRLSESGLAEQEQREINHVLESARMFRDLEREEACVNLVEEAERIAGQLDASKEVEKRAAEQLGHSPEAEGEDSLTDVPAYRLIGRPLVNDDGEPMGEVVDVVVSEGGGRVAVLRVGELLEDQSRTVAVDLERLEPTEMNRVRLVGLTRDELEDMPEFDPVMDPVREE